jgi:hypothetical protein
VGPVPQAPVVEPQRRHTINVASRTVKIVGGFLAAVVAAGGIAVLAGTAEADVSAAAAPPIGTGWKEVSATDYKIDQPPGRSRHTLANGEHHFWVLKSDPSTYPGRDSGPRSELRFYNDYKTGQAQFAADIKVAKGCSKASIMQIFGAQGRSTAFMTFAMNDSLNHYSGQKIYGPIYDKYLRVNVIHNTGTRKVEFYVNGKRYGTFSDHGSANHYFKAGVYHQPGMSPRCDVYMKNITLFKK